MTALTKNRNTPQRGPLGHDLYLTVKNAEIIFQGALVVNDAGEAAEGRTATGLVALGRAEEKVDNTADGKSITVRQGTFKWANSAAGDEIVAADIGKACYIVDDQTVAKTDGTGTRSKAGVVVDVESDGVWVETTFGTV